MDTHTWIAFGWGPRLPGLQSPIQLTFYPRHVTSYCVYNLPLLTLVFLFLIQVPYWPSGALLNQSLCLVHSSPYLSLQTCQQVIHERIFYTRDLSPTFAVIICPVLCYCNYHLKTLRGGTNLLPLKSPLLFSPNPKQDIHFNSYAY